MLYQVISKSLPNYGRIYSKVRNTELGYI